MPSEQCSGELLLRSTCGGGPQEKHDALDGTGSTGPVHFVLSEHEYDDDDAEVAPSPFHDLLGELSKPVSGTQRLVWFSLLILGSVCLVACGAWFGLRFATKKQLQDLGAAIVRTDCIDRAASNLSFGEIARAVDKGLIQDGANCAASASNGTDSLAEQRATLVRNSSPIDNNTSEGYDDVYPDLTCFGTKRVEWLAVKALTQEWFGTWEAGVVARERSWLQGLLDFVISRLEAFVQDLQEDCGMGRLCITLLALCAAEDGSDLNMAPSFHSPLLTIRLDIPWLIVMRSGWPLFGLMAQLQIQHHRNDDTPSSGPSKEYFDLLLKAIAAGNTELVVTLGVEFVAHQDAEEQRDQKGSERAQVMPALCALASQLLGFAVVVPPVSAEKTLGHMQDFFRESVRNIHDLQSTLHSTWPLWGILSQVAVIFSRPL